MGGMVWGMIQVHHIYYTLSQSNAAIDLMGGASPWLEAGDPCHTTHSARELGPKYTNQPGKQNSYSFASQENVEWSAEKPRCFSGCPGGEHSGHPRLRIPSAAGFM